MFQDVAKCPEESGSHDYVGKSGLKVSERVKDYNVGDTSPTIFKN